MSSDESWADSGAESEESSAEEREEQAESSETDEEFKYKRFPFKNWRWPVGEGTLLNSPDAIDGVNLETLLSSLSPQEVNVGTNRT